METRRIIYRIKRDMSEIIEVIPAEETNVENIPVEKIISKILHKIIVQKEDDNENYEDAEPPKNSGSLCPIQFR